MKYDTFLYNKKIIDLFSTNTKTRNLSLSNFISEKEYFLDEINILKIKELIKTIEYTIHNKLIKDSIFSKSHKISNINHNNGGSFLSFDFHITSDGPKLIEINTNAGGGLLFTEYLKIKYEVYNDRNKYLKLSYIQDCFINMLTNEFYLQFPTRKLKSVAIVDLDPTSQPLFPELYLYKIALELIDIQAFIVDPGELILINNEIHYNGIKIDLIYNRLTDFYFEESYSRKIKLAYILGTVSVSPNPRYHALYASKSNLSLLSNIDKISKFSLSEDQITTLVNTIPLTTLVTPENSSELWSNRRNLFFKPATGFGGKAAYRGKGITKKVWSLVTQGGYVAQDYIPAEIKIFQNESFKSDLRVYVYQGKIQFYSARLYKGQTTNFSSKGGGFAEVISSNTLSNINQSTNIKELSL
ncbi:MAG: hypothetical protein ACI843_001109 [Psychrobacter glaciei]